ncbi:MAG: response regulator [Desulfobacterales bacterium]|nr:response regulator [Desulfobacterales bacterium]
MTQQGGLAVLGTILVVEDEVKLSSILRDYLMRAGYSVATLVRGDEVLEWLETHSADLMLLDLMLPGMDGVEVCRQVRKSSELPIIMLTARVDEADRLVGLELGADDYICKPFSPREVVARVKAVLRRTERSALSNRPLTRGPLRLFPTQFRVEVNKEELHLTPSEFGLLKAFMGSPERVFTRSDLLNMVQGYQYEGYDRTIDSHIKNLRRKFADVLPGVQVVEAVYGVGYRMSREICGAV